MTIFVLLLSLLVPFVSVPPQEKTVPAVSSAVQQPAMLALGHAVSTDSYISSFDSLSGISLYMPEEELLLARGTPQQIVPDPMGDCQEYQYAGISAGICGGIVLYVNASPSQAEQYGLLLNDRELDPLKSNLQQMLGAPDFEAEDGDVYIRGSAALKVYRNTDTGEWTGIDLFDKNSF